MTDSTSEVGGEIRRLLRGAAEAGLSTLSAEDGGPYGSLVLLAVDHDATPLLLLSDLAVHSRNLAADPRLCLLVQATAGYDDPLEGPRASLLGRAERDDDPRRLARFVARHPAAAGYAGFRDFHLYRVELERAHLVAGFGRIHWVAASEVLYRGATAAPMAEEAALLAEFNGTREEELGLMARHLLGRAAGAWRLTGVDPEGGDLRCGRAVARLAFDPALGEAEGCRARLLRLGGEARERSEVDS
jgi:putative heme iron utilization protein